MKFHAAKIDRWVPLVFGGAAAFVTALAVTFLSLGLGTDKLPLTTAIKISALDGAIGVLMIALLIGCYRIRYEIGLTDLRIRCGPFCSTVPLDAIIEVFPTRNPTGAPAPSFDRLQIEYWKGVHARGTALVSPADKTAFVRDLAEAAPHLQEVGDERLRARAGTSAGMKYL
jgi:hypothetical protein